MIRFLIAAAMAAAILYSTVSNADPRHKAAAPAGSGAARDAASKLDEYLKNSNEALRKYYARNRELHGAFIAADERELSKLRSANPEAYAQWLDAIKAKDAGKAAELERTVPEIARYAEARKLALDEYQKRNKEAFALYEEANRREYNRMIGADTAAQAQK